MVLNFRSSEGSLQLVHLFVDKSQVWVVVFVFQTLDDFSEHIALGVDCHELVQLCAQCSDGGRVAARLRAHVDNGLDDGDGAVQKLLVVASRRNDASGRHAVVILCVQLKRRVLVLDERVLPVLLSESFLFFFRIVFLVSRTIRLPMQFPRVVQAI